MSRPGPTPSPHPRKNLYLRLARQLQHNRSMACRGTSRTSAAGRAGRLWAAATRARLASRAAVFLPAVFLPAVFLAGCFYLEDINQRPAIEIKRVTETAIERGGTVELLALVNDPDSPVLSLKWSAFACAATTEQCDEAPLAESSALSFAPSVPVRTAGGEPVQHLRITLDAEDERGARARLPQRLDLDIGNAAPVITAVQPVGNATLVGVPLELRARRVDPDDPTASLVTTWKVYGPPGTAHPPLRPLPSSDPDVVAQELTPDVTGPWTIEVTVTDPVGATVTAQRALVITGDLPPCLSVISPLAAIPLLLDQPRSFSALVVTDELDPFPALPGGAARFSWSLLAPSRGLGRQLLAGANGNSVALDPATFPPGEHLELRVEVADRITRTLPCAADDPSCSIEGSACTQRQTWRLEVR